METAEVISLMDRRAQKTEREQAVTIPTGSKALDFALDGGYARGKIVEVCGDFSTYKTTLALYAVAQAQKLGQVMWLDSGDGLLAPHAERCGVDLSKLIIHRPETAHHAMYAMRNRASDFALMVMDSASFMVLEEGLDEIVPFDVLFDWLKQDLAAPRSTALFISNWRKDRDNPFTTELRRWASQRIVTKASMNHQVVVEVPKNSVTSPADFYVSLRFDKAAQIDAEYELVRLAEALGVIVRRGSWLYCDGFMLGQGVEGAVGTLRNDPGYLQEINDAIATALA